MRRARRGKGRGWDKTPGGFAKIYRMMLSSEAWASIGNAARVAYVHIKAKAISDNPGEIWISFKEMERLMTHHTFFSAIEELEATGFIKKIQYGGLYRRRNSYVLCDDWKIFKTQRKKLHSRQCKICTVEAAGEQATV